ncbi:alpha/beta hydrolase [Streptomyces sp. SYSU K217416]
MSKSITRRRRIHFGVVVSTGVAAVTLAVAGAATATSDADRKGAKPTVVLVHGAFAESASWDGVIKRLQKDGYPVVAPANPLRGVHSDAAYLSSVLDSIKGPVILAGHSYGGSIISQAAVGNKNVKALVYVAAFSPDKGETAAELSGKFPGSTLGPTLNKVPFPLADGSTGTDLYINADKYRQQFAADVPKTQADVMAATQRPIAVSALEEKATGAAWKQIPSWTLVTLADNNIPAQAQLFMADRAQSRTTKIDASHSVTVSRPNSVAKMIENAAETTVR